MIVLIPFNTSGMFHTLAVEKNGEVMELVMTFIPTVSMEPTYGQVSNKKNAFI